MNAGKYQVKTRNGWGWEVIGPNFQSYPIETAIAAQEFARALNEGQQVADARRAAGLYFSDMRYYAYEAA